MAFETAGMTASLAKQLEKLALVRNRVRKGKDWLKAEYTCRRGGLGDRHESSQMELGHPFGPTCYLWLASEDDSRTHQGGARGLKGADLVRIIGQFSASFCSWGATMVGWNHLRWKGCIIFFASSPTTSSSPTRMRGRCGACCDLLVAGRRNANGEAKHQEALGI